jgi:hypothetical protein
MGQPRSEASTPPKERKPSAADGSGLMASPFTTQDEFAASRAATSARVKSPVTTAVAHIRFTDSKKSVKHRYQVLQGCSGCHERPFGSSDGRSKIAMGRRPEHARRDSNPSLQPFYTGRFGNTVPTRRRPSTPPPLPVAVNVLGPLGPARTREPDNLRTPTAVIETRTQRAESICLAGSPPPRAGWFTLRNCRWLGSRFPSGRPDGRDAHEVVVGS